MLVGAGLLKTVCFCQALKGPKACVQQVASANVTSADASTAAIHVIKGVLLIAKKLADCGWTPAVYAYNSELSRRADRTTPGKKHIKSAGN